MQQQQHVNDLADYCESLKFSVACLEQEKTALQETNQQVNDAVLELQR